MEFSFVTEGAFARITLTAPERHNALTREMIAGIAAALDEVDAAKELRFLVLTGAGRSFCAGVDLGNVEGQDWTENPLTGLCDRLERVRVPTLCALNGGVYGGGVELALACDFRIGVEGMRLFVPPAELGIHYPPQGMARAERLLGLHLTRRLFLLAERLSDAELAASPFLDRLVAPEALENAVAEMAARVCGLAPLAVEGMKRALAEIAQDPPDFTSATARIATCFASADHAEALTARKEKRPPVFRRG